MRFGSIPAKKVSKPGQHCQMQGSGYPVSPLGESTLVGVEAGWEGMETEEGGQKGKQTHRLKGMVLRGCEKINSLRAQWSPGREFCSCLVLSCSVFLIKKTWV